MTRLPVRLGRFCGRLLLGLLGFGLGLILLALLAFGALVWRLNQGPMDVTGLAHRLEASLAPQFSSGRVVLSMEKAGGMHLLRVDAQQLGRHVDGRIVDSAQSITVLAPVRRLVRLDAIPTDVTASGVRIELTRSTGASGGPVRVSLRDLGPLQHVRITDLQLTVADAVLHTSWQLTGASVVLQRQGDGVSAQAEGRLAAANVAAHVTVTGRVSDTGAHLQAASTAVSPAELARAVPALGALAALDAPVSLKADGDFGPLLQLQHASLHAEAGAGTVLLPAKGGTPSPARFAALALDADGTPEDVTLQALRVVLAPLSGNPPSNLVLAGTLHRNGDQLVAQATLNLDKAALSDLGALWPERVGGGSRPWLVENLTNGVAHDGHFAFALRGSLRDGLELTSASGSMPAEDVTIWWLRPVPPIEHAHVMLTLVDADTMLITGSGGRTGTLLIKTASMRITGLKVRDQVSVLNADMAGPLGDVFTLLANPRLSLLSKRPVAVTNPTGSVVAHLTVTLPLETKLTVEQIGIHATSKITDAHLGNIVAGRSLDHAQIALDVSNDGLKATGTGLLDQLPSKLQYELDFRDGPPNQVLAHAAAAITVTPQAAAAAGLGAIGLQSGVLLTNVDYTARRDGTAIVGVALNGKEAAFDTPIGWAKPAGVPGVASGKALLDHGRLVGLQAIQANAPGLSISASGEMAGGRVTTVHISEGQVGRTSATGTIGLPQAAGQPYRVTLSGARLDLEGRLNNSGGIMRQSQPSSPADDAGVPYVADIRFNQVRFGPGQEIGPLVLQATGTGQRLTAGHLASRGPERVEADLVTVAGERRLHATAGNLGLLLRQTGLAHELDGGQMGLDGVFDDRQSGSPFAGTLRLNKFSVRGAPVTAKVLQALTVYGLAEALSGPGLVFSRLVAPFRLNASVLQLKDARANSASLGVTASGRLDFDHNTLELSGTIVPAYALNSLPGRVPFLGKLFSPEKGSGLFAANYSLSGAIDDPSVSINPLSALTPGFTRGLFSLFR